MENHYKRWQDPDIVEKFANKSASDFFLSETYFLEKIKSQLSSVLDIGCASGRMIELLQQLSIRAEYTGLDIIQKNIEIAKKNYPGINFIWANALDFKPNKKFDLVNATGVFQHEPKFESLVHRMVELSSRYVMFDAKLALVQTPISNIEQSYCEVGSSRLFFVLVSLPNLLNILSKISGISRISIYGYETAPSKTTYLPEGIERLVSAGVFLELGKQKSAEIVMELPDWIRHH